MIGPGSPRDPRVIALMDAQQTEICGVYENNVTEPFDPAVLEGEGCVLLVDVEGGELVACAALKRWDDGATAEVKRMYTAPAERGKGRAARLLEALVTEGRRLGYARIVLETGDLLKEAIALYERAGFVRIPNYGFYEGIEQSYCFELPLGTTGATSASDGQRPDPRER
ncbi:MAG: putative acyltransferase [Labilithrix sp.]|nr:putative acyltransferase [Labilithrix sp.]